MDQVKRTLRPLHYIIFIFLCIVLAIFCFFNEKVTKMPQTQNIIALPTDNKTVVKATTAISPQTHTETYTISHNETLAEVFHRAHLPPDLWITILTSQEASTYLERLQEKRSIVITKDASNQFVSLQYGVDDTKTLQVYLQDNHPRTLINKKPVTKTVQFKSSVIHHSLAQAEKATGLPAPLQHQLDQMLASGGFTHDIHPGDHLNVLYHEYFVGDQENHAGNIVAAEITHGKETHRIVRFTTPNHQTGFYMPNGTGTQPAFLKAPLAYKRIGSKFQYSRLDPVIHKVHPHLGVDLDAPRGTPVKAVGNGVILFSKQIRGYGNVVMIRYNKTYKTMYAHLEKFALHTHANTPVKKGQIVGYVGSTGWATGPHLHYAVYKNGIAVNPLTVQFPAGNSIPARYRQGFLYKENHWFNEMRLFEAAQAPAKPKIIAQHKSKKHV